MGWTRNLTLVLVLTIVAVPVHALDAIEGLTVDTSVTIAYLTGTRVIRDAEPEMSLGGTRFRLESDERIPFASGTAEIMPPGRFSCRGFGGLSFFEPKRMIRRSTNLNFAAVEPDSEVTVKPKARVWEVAGLYHLYQEGGYRFSLSGGYRRQNWLYDGEENGITFHESLTTHIPFVGLQTTMFFPWYKARFEVIASPLVRKKVRSDVQGSNASTGFEGVLASGGFIELQLEGTVQFSSRVQAGLVGRYSFEDLRGTISGHTNGWGTTQYDTSSNENIAVIGLEATLFF